ncbi:MAG: PKD domain-containing protein [Planctomycetes bacterium]|nr:PKD domain-containing protein [Planctomycetota bacterium]
MHRHLVLIVPVLALGLATSAAAQTPIAMPPFQSTYVAAAARGFYFFCPTACVITGLEAPNEAAQPNQVVEVLDFGGLPPAPFPATTAPVSQLFYDNAVPAGTKVSASVALQAGRFYGIFGCCTDALGSATSYSSYGNGPFTTSIQGIPVVLNRLVTQSGIASNGGNQPCSSSTGRIGRVLVDIAPAAGLYAGFTADVQTGVSPLTVQFTDTSYTNAAAGITSWAWDFDNNGSVDSTLQHPTHVFSTCGNFDVKLTVTDSQNPPDFLVEPAFVRTDELTVAFDVSLQTAPNVWQFTDLTTPTPTTWAWDFDNDGSVDSTLQNPTYTSPGPCLDTTVALVVTRACRSGLTIERTFRAAASFLGETGGGNFLSSPTSVGNYFDLEVTAAPGIVVCGLAVTPAGLAGPFDLSVYLSEDTHVGKEGDSARWRLVGVGSGDSAGGGFAPPAVVDVGVDEPFLLPTGSYGMAVFLSSPSGMGLAYTDGPASSPYVGADLVLHPAGVGSASVSELGPIAFAPRLWNGGVHYSLCSAAPVAASGFFGSGCAGALGTPRLDPNGTVPALGTTYQLIVDRVPGSVAIMMAGLSHTFAAGYGALPFDAGGLGAPGCLLRVSPDTTVLLLAAGSTATWSFPVPNTPAFLCLPLYNQAAVLSSGANALGAVVSDARAAIVGN